MIRKELFVKVITCLFLFLAIGDFFDWKYIPYPEYFEISEKIIALIMLFSMWYEMNIPSLLGLVFDKKMQIIFLIILFGSIASMYRVLYTSKIWFMRAILPKHAQNACEKAELKEQCYLTKFKEYIILPISLISNILFIFFLVIISGTVAVNKSGLIYGLYSNLDTFLRRIHPNPDRFFTNYFSKRTRPKGIFRPLAIFAIRFAFISFIVLFFTLFFFYVLNQWFIESIDKSIFVITILFCLHNTEYLSASSAATKIDEIEKKLIRSITSLLKVPKYFILGIAGFLILYILSEIGAFFVPYIIGHSYYIGKLEETGYGTHENIFTLLKKDLKEIPTIEKPFLATIYFISFFGLLFLLITPCLLWFFASQELLTAKKYRLKYNKYFVYLTLLFIFSTMVYILVPWIKLKKIPPGEVIYGVDFPTSQILRKGEINEEVVSIVKYFEFNRFTIFLAIIGLPSILVGILFLWQKKVANLIILFIFAASVIYLTLYFFMFASSMTESIYRGLKSHISIAVTGYHIKQSKPYTRWELIFGNTTDCKYNISQIHRYGVLKCEHRVMVEKYINSTYPTGKIICSNNSNFPKIVYNWSCVKICKTRYLGCVEPQKRNLIDRVYSATSIFFLSFQLILVFFFFGVISACFIIFILIPWLHDQLFYKS